MGCPIDISIERCYTQALPGLYEGQLGFELVEVFQSSPTLGPIKINDQYAEEAFTVYDHPKVFVFQKTDQFNLTETASILGEVDLDRVIHITPKQADNHPGDLMLPEDQLEIQREGGTWSQLFNSDSLLNRSQVISVIVWYLAVFMLGLAVFSLLRPVMGGLKDHGYPLSRVFGLLLLSYLSWLAGSLNIPYQKTTIAGAGMVILLAGAAAAYLQRGQLLEQWKTQRKYLLLIEGLALAVFLIGLLIRFGNPDLWHPWKGGEKPMDFSYFNAVLKSTSIPPYDPWFAGGYINYYYYGFVLVGTLVKLLGITPAIAYNLILPTVLMLTGIGVFSIVWNLSEHGGRQEGGSQRSLAAGGAGLLTMVFLGNLGMIRMFLQGIQRLASGGINPVEGGFFQRLLWTAVGLLQFFRTGTLGYRLDEWYWNPSRVIGAEHGGPITEFPFFTFLYGDLHAHFLALPLTVLALAWMVSIVLARKNQPSKEGWLHYFALPVFGALVVGALRPTNTWDYYPYLALGIAAIGFSWIGKQTYNKPMPWLKAAGQIALFGFLTSLLYQPYLNWYGAGYTTVKNWYGTKTPLNDYFTHWGLFLIVILSWMAAETIQWMASTPATALKKLKPVRELILGLLLLMLVIMLSQGTSVESGFELGGIRWIGAGVHVIWFVLPVMVWAGIMLLRPELSAAKQVVVFLIGTGLAITLMVELVYVEGDIGRMNTVFKFYLQTWTLYAVSGGAAFGWLLSSINKWPKRLSVVWKAVFFALLFGAALYPVLGGVAKIKDRMAPEAPSTLDGMLFMKYADYSDLNTELDLEEDYYAIRWMQENVQGSPVIVEANQVEYHWGTRYTVYTGNPGVVGWNWHQRQQRTTVPHNWVFDRVEDVNLFYDTTDLGFARDFLQKYQVEYIVVGQLERAKYASDGLEKFPAAAGVLWEEVYQQGDTTIYRTISASMP
jgi:YYY domain-containing protein